MVSSRSSQDKYIKDGNRLKQRVGVGLLCCWSDKENRRFVRDNS